MTKIEKEEFLERVKHGKKGEIYELDADDLLDILEIIMDDEIEEEEARPEKGPEPKKPEGDLLEEFRKSAYQAKQEVAKMHGKETADDVVAYASVGVMITSCIELDLPIKQEWVDEFNSLLEKIHPEIGDSVLLPMAYVLLEKMREEGVQSLE